MPKVVDESPAPAPAWLLWPVRAIAVAVVLPFRLTGSALSAAGRLLSRFVLGPLARLWHHLVAVPASRLWRTLLRPPARWLGHALGRLIGWILAVPVILIGVPAMWLWENALLPAARLSYRWLLRPIGRAVAVVARFLRTWLLAPICRAIVRFLRLGWQGTSWLFRMFHRYLLRPIGLAVAWGWRHTFGVLIRGFAHVWRSLITPAAR